MGATGLDNKDGWKRSMTDEKSYQSQLEEMMPDALMVIRETIQGIVNDEGKGWSKDSISCSQWLVEKVTGKPRTEDEKSNDGMLRKLLEELNARKPAPAADSMSIQNEFIEREPLDEIDQFVKEFGE